MMDFVLIVITITVFVLAQGYTRACDRLKGTRP